MLSGFTAGWADEGCDGRTTVPVAGRDTGAPTVGRVADVPVEGFVGVVTVVLGLLTAVLPVFLSVVILTVGRVDVDTRVPLDEAAEETAEFDDLVTELDLTVEVDPLVEVERDTPEPVPPLLACAKASD